MLPFSVISGNFLINQVFVDFKKYTILVIKLDKTRVLSSFNNVLLKKVFELWYFCKEWYLQKIVKKILLNTNFIWGN